MAKLPILSCIAAACLLGFLPSTAQEKTGSSQSAQQSAAAGAAAPGQQPTAVLKVRTRMVVVDVIAQNNKGETVTDLTLQDFVITEDDHPQKISAFNFQHPDAALKPVKVPDLPTGTVNNLPQYQPNGALNVLLLDALNTTSTNQAYAREMMVKMLAKLPQGQPMAIYLLGSKLRLIQDFTSDPDVLRQAALNVKGQPSRLLDNPAGTSPAAAPMGSVASELIASVPGLANQLSQFEAEQSVARNDSRVAYTLQALNSLARTLAGYPGRKNLIWVSETFPFDILLNQIGRRSFQTESHYANDVARTGSLLSDAQVAVYPVDPRGMSNNSIYSVGSDPNPTAGGNVSGATLRGGMGASMNADSNNWLAARTTMNDLAEKTGGRAFYNRNDIDGAVLESIRDGSSYYTLGYYPDNKRWNSEFRNIHVKVNRPGVKLHYRAGYFAVDHEAIAQANPKKQDEDFDEALALEWPVSTGLPFQAQVLPPSAQTQNKVLVRFRVDPHALNFQPDDQGLQHVNLLCAVRAYTVKDFDKPVRTEANRMAGALNPDAYGKIVSGYFPCQQQVELPPGKYVLRLGVRDNSTGLIGTASAALEIAAAATGEASRPEEKKP
jgi:VWFA-related protein